MKFFNINIVGLRFGRHQFEYEFGDNFFEGFEGGSLAKEEISATAFSAVIALDKHETFIEVGFNIQGKVTLVCDRSLDTFEHAIKIDKRMVFKYGDEAAELSDEIIVIQRDAMTLGLDQYVYEFIMLSLPMKRLHPKFGAEDDDDSEGKLIWSSSTDAGGGDDAIDPRWEKLKKLK